MSTVNTLCIVMSMSFNHDLSCKPLMFVPVLLLKVLIANERNRPQKTNIEAARNLIFFRYFFCISVEVAFLLH